MSYPVVQSITPSIFDAGDTLSHAALMPATLDPGDLLLALVGWPNNFTITTPTGWTLKPDDSFVGLRASVYARVADGTERGTTVDFVSATAEKMVCQVYRITGWKGSVTNDIALADTPQSVANATPDSPVVTPGWGGPDTLWLSVAMCANNLGSVTYPTNYTDGRWDQTPTSGTGNRVAIESARRSLTATSENPGTFTNGASQPWIAYTIAIRPSVSYAVVQHVETTTVINNSPDTVPLVWPQNTTAGNLLVASIANKQPVPNTCKTGGWLLAGRVADVQNVEIWYRVGAGADAAPTFTAPTNGLYAQTLAEYSGLASWALDRIGTGLAPNGTGTITVSTNALTSVLAELIVGACGDSPGVSPFGVWAASTTGGGATLGADIANVPIGSLSEAIEHVWAQSGVLGTTPSITFNGGATNVRLGAVIAVFGPPVAVRSQPTPDPNAINFRSAQANN